MISVICAFKEAMRNAGIEPPSEITADGGLYRFHVVGDKGFSRNGWYVLYPDYPPAGRFGCWKRRISQRWSTKEYRVMTAYEKAVFNAKMERIRGKHEEVQKRVHAECRERSAALWDRASPAQDRHGYLQGKQVKAYGLKWYRGALLVPVRDENGVLHGLQKIWRMGDGGKGFEVGTAVAGHFHLIGARESPAIIICEGYATGASLHEATGLPVVVAFDAGNLKPVAEIFRLMYPGGLLVIAADNDQWTYGNPGIAKAAEAAQAVDGVVVVASFSEVGERPTDFNDLYRGEGKEAVLRAFRQQGVSNV